MSKREAQAAARCRRRHQPDRRTHYPRTVAVAMQPGADVGTNLIDGHQLSNAKRSSGGRCRRRHQPDRRTPPRCIMKIPKHWGADVGTNLIDGHIWALL